MRVKLQQVSYSRVVNAIQRRIKAIPSKISWSYSSFAKENKIGLSKFKNKHKNKRCILIANGPSLKGMDLSFLKNEISFGLNRIYLAYDDYNFKNDYLVCINNLVLTQFSDELEKQPMPKFFNWSERGLFKNINNLNFIYRSFWGNKFGKDLSVSSNPAATVTYAALQVIYYMGFKEVIIIGMDHNFLTKEKNRPNKTEVRDEAVDVNHFHPNYFPKGSKWDTPDLVSSEYFYKIARHEFENDDRKIIDCTVGGKCQIFEKGNIENYK